MKGVNSKYNLQTHRVIKPNIHDLKQKGEKND